MDVTWLKYCLSIQERQQFENDGYFIVKCWNESRTAVQMDVVDLCAS